MSITQFECSNIFSLLNLKTKELETIFTEIRKYNKAFLDYYKNYNESRRKAQFALDQLQAKGQQNSASAAQLRQLYNDPAQKETVEATYRVLVTYCNKLIHLVKYEILPKFNDILTRIKKELSNWKKQQKSGQYGVSTNLDASLSKIITWFKNLMENVFVTLTTVENAMPVSYLNQLKECKDLSAELRALMCDILNSSFVITKQPPMVVKQCKQNVTVGFLSVIDKFGFESLKVSSQCDVISEDSARVMQKDIGSGIEKLDISKHSAGIMNKSNENIEILTVEYKNTETGDNEKYSYYGFDFKGLELKVKSRKNYNKNPDAIKSKYYLRFSTQVTISGLLFNVHALSLPFMVSVHGSQDPVLMPKAFWDMAFSDTPDEIPMQGKEAVNWESELSIALRGLFGLITKCQRQLSDQDLAYLKYRLQNGNPSANSTITLQDFLEKPMIPIPASAKIPVLTFTFSGWFFDIMHMIAEKPSDPSKIKKMWDDNLIQGFLPKSMAQSMLLECDRPTLLLRFSENHMGSVSAAVKYENRSVVHLKPFKWKGEVEKYSLPKVVLSCQELDDVQYIYPDKLKQQLEQYIPKTKVEVESDYDIYVETTLKIVSSVNQKLNGNNRRTKENAQNERKVSSQSSRSAWSPSDFQYTGVQSPVTSDIFSTPISSPGMVNSDSVERAPVEIFGNMQTQQNGFNDVYQPNNNFDHSYQQPLTHTTPPDPSIANLIAYALTLDDLNQLMELKGEVFEQILQNCGDIEMDGIEDAIINPLDQNSEMDLGFGYNFK